MTPIPPPADDLAVMINCLGLHDPSPALRNCITWVKAHKTLAERPPIRVVPDEHDPATWWIDGRRMRFTRGSNAFWPYWSALHGEAAYCCWTAQTPATVRNARLRIIADLEDAGHAALAEEVGKVTVTDHGQVIYLPDDASPRLLFE